MKGVVLRNWIIIILLFFVIPLIITFEVSIAGFQIIISFFIILDTLISIIFTSNYVYFKILEKDYDKNMEKFFNEKPEDISKYRIAALISSYNEDPFMVSQNAVTAGYSVLGLKNVFVLDDSTDQKIVRDLKDISKNLDFKLIHRDKRRGYKAGAINDWLKEYGDKYDYIFILDADQMSIPGALDRVMQFFRDKKLAYVQFPQYYSGYRTYLGLAAWLQQIPFFRMIMRGRDVRNTPFVIGTGTVLRIKALKEVGGFYENTVTEDIYTSVLIQEKGYYGKYIDFPAIWKGNSPDTYLGYWIQQSRWSLGGFQLFPKLMSAKLNLKQFWDFFNGDLYWLKIGLFPIFEVLAPFIFLVFGIPYFKSQVAIFFTLYLFIFAPSLIFYILSLHKYSYGFGEFSLHNGLQFIDMFPTLTALFTFISRKKQPFKVTPKNSNKKAPIIILIPIYITISILLIAFSVGIFKLIHASNNAYILAIGINIFWVSWLIFGFSIGLFLSLQKKLPAGFRNIARQNYDKEFIPLHSVLYNSMLLEKSISNYYSRLTLKIKNEKIKNILSEEAKESMIHSNIYRDCLSKVNFVYNSDHSYTIKYFAAFLGGIISEKYRDCIKNSSKGSINLINCILLDEELLMRSMAQFSIEILGKNIDNDLLMKLSRIVNDEKNHFFESLYIIESLK